MKKGKQQQQDDGSVLKNISFFLTNLRRAKGLKEPRKYEDYNREAKDLFVTETGEGLSVSLNKMVNQTAQHEFGIGHSVFVGGSGQRPPDYNISVSFANKTTQFFSQINTQMIQVAQFKHKFFKEALTTDGVYISSNGNIILKGDYTGKDYIIDAQYEHENGKIQLSYLQNILPYLSLGCSGYLKTSDRVSGLATCFRYHPSKETVITGELKQSGAVTNNYSLKGSYYQQTDIDTFMGAEVTYDLTERAVNFVYGFQQNFQQAKVRVTANQDFIIRASFDIMPSITSQVNIGIEANPAKSEFKFGASVNLA
ncbi:hypothetical protein ABK040_003681 [Willaertia magna]